MQIDNGRAITKEMLGGLLTAAFKRGYTAGTRAVLDNDNCVPLTREAYLQLRDEAAKAYIEQMVKHIIESEAELYQVR